MIRNQAWYVVHTRPHAEEIAARHLDRQGFRVFLPRFSRRRRHARKVETVIRPLFPRYLFVGLDLAVDRWNCIRSTVGVAGLICHGDRPTLVPPGVVEGLLDREVNGVIAVNDRTNFRRGDRVQLLDGAFANLVGIFERMTDGDRVAVLLDLLGRSVRVVLHVDALQPAN
jgi:transcriptional antiterminator RfaH